MEDILGVYKRPFDPARPLICLDETNRQLLGDLREPTRCAPGKPARYDCDFKAGSKLNLFMTYAPILGWRHVKVTQRRCATDWAEVIRELLEERFPEAEKLVLVMDNLNTHAGSSLYKTFPPAHARKLLDRLEIHYTPKHGSWLNIAEIELSVLARQCLSKRMEDEEEMKAATHAWAQHRNEAQADVKWRFTAEDARIKLHRLYPTISV
jgi:hypothetical protein